MPIEACNTASMSSGRVAWLKPCTFLLVLLAQVSIEGLAPVGAQSASSHLVEADMAWTDDSIISTADRSLEAAKKKKKKKKPSPPPPKRLNRPPPPKGLRRPPPPKKALRRPPPPKRLVRPPPPKKTTPVPANPVPVTPAPATPVPAMPAPVPTASPPPYGFNNPFPYPNPVNPYPGGIAMGFEWSPVAANPKIVTVGYGTGHDFNIPVGAVDSYAIIQQALDSLKASNGGIVRVAAGTYHFSWQFWIRVSNTRLEGAGMNETVFKLADNAKFWKNAGFLRALKTDNVTVAKLTLDGNKAKQINGQAEGYGRYCLFMAIYRNWKYDLVRCKSWQRYGFDPHGIKPKDNNVDQAIWSYGLTIVNCMSDDNNWDGFTLDQTYFVYLSNNYACDNGRYGYNVVTGARHVIVENNVAVNNGYGPQVPEWEYDGGNGCGFQVDSNIEELWGFETYNVTLRNNYVYKAFRAGFCVKDQRVKGTYIRNNAVSNSGACGDWKRLKFTYFENNICGPDNLKQFTTSSPDPNEVVITGNTFP